VIVPPRFIESFLALPLPILALLVLLAWGLIAVLVHRFLVPRLAGHDGSAMGKFEAEVAAQVGIVLGLLLSFNAVTVWEHSGAARDATLAEASALREVHDLLPEMPPDQQPALREALRRYVTYVIHDEWPQLATGSPSLEKPASLRALTRLGRTTGDEDLHDAVDAAVDARDDRIRIATSRMLPARWSIVIILGVLTILAIGLIHAEHPRSRAIAVGMVAFGIGSCFVVLLAQARPFLGTLALRPTELTALTAEMDREPPAR